MQPPTEGSNLPVPAGRPSRDVPDAAWTGYLTNLGLWIGKRALSNARGKVLLDLPSRVSAQLFRTSSDELFVLWRTTIRTADGLDEAEEEWSRGELADFAALAADGSFSVGAPVFRGEPITIDQCILDDGLRVRTTHAFDWEGCLSGIVATREKFVSSSPSTVAADDDELQTAFVEPIAWRNPRVLLDYMLGLWEGRGVCIDVISGMSYTLTSRFKMTQSMDPTISESSVLTIGEGGPTRVFEATGQVDTNFIIFPEANVQTFLLPGGVFVSAPIRIRRGRPFTVETGFLMRPDCRKRIQRVYNRDAEWVNTIFINERRVG